MSQRRSSAVVLVTLAGSLVSTTIAVAILEHLAGLPDASSIYLLAVLAVAIAGGPIAASATAVAAFLLYDFLFTRPFLTLRVADPGEWLTLILLLAVGIVVGQLAGAQRDRAEAAERRARESLMLFNVSWILATRRETGTALAAIAALVERETRASRVWLTLGLDAAERVVADSGGQALPPRPAIIRVLKRRPGDLPARWLSVHEPRVRPASATGTEAYRVDVEAAGRSLGSLWSVRSRHAGPPNAEETRALASAADQVGQAIEQDRLRLEAAEAEVARRSDALKSALLDAVSHDLRTPLAAIRAAAGSLADPEVDLSLDEQRGLALSIDREAARLGRLVTNMLDLGRIEAGALRLDAEPFDLDDLVRTGLSHQVARAAVERPIEVDIPLDLPPVVVDATFFEPVLTNVVENALAYAPAPAAIRIRAREIEGGGVELSVEDGGPGVPQASLGRLFEKFYRVPGPDRPRHRGTGLGLAVAQGLLGAMGGGIAAERSELGGLAIRIRLPAAKRSAADGRS